MWKITSSSFRRRITPAILMLACTLPAQGVEMLSNGGFESGLSGWTELVGAGQGHVVTQGQAGPQGFSPNTPRSGSHLFSASVNEGATPGTPEITLHQLVTLPTSPAGASFDVHASLFAAGAQGNTISSDDTVEIILEFRDAAGLAVGFAATPPLDPVPGSWNLLQLGAVPVPATAVFCDFRVRMLLDAGFASIDIGVDDVSLTWTATASCTVRNGSGVNPVELACATLPALGTTWTLDTTANANTLVTAVFLSDAALPVPVPLLGGEALIGPNLISIAGSGQHSIALPPQPALQGAPFHVQGLRIDAVAGVAQIVLLNALDCVLGS